MNFSIITQSPEIRAIVQDGALEREFKDALFPRMLYRGEVEAVLWPSHAGDTFVQTATGLMAENLQPIVPGFDPPSSTYGFEQWVAQLKTYGNSKPTHMPTSVTAIASLLMQDAQKLGLNAARSLNKIVRNKLYNAALSGHTVADGASLATVTVPVKRLNGFTRARDATGSPVQFSLVSATNPLPIVIFDNGAETTRNVVGFTPTTAGDEVGPGSLTLDAAIVSVADRAYVLSVDRTALVRVGGGNSVDALGANDILRLEDIRSAMTRFSDMNVPEHPDGYYHCHIDPTAQGQIFSDPEFQRLHTSLPDYYPYARFALGAFLGAIYIKNSEAPQASTVVGGSTATFSQQDPFAGELYSNGTTTGVKVHRTFFSGQGGMREYYQDLSELLTAAGITGAVGEFQISNNGIEVLSERIQFIIRAPLNIFQDSVTSAWKFVGDWPIRTDVLTGDAARFKRGLVVESGTA